MERAALRDASWYRRPSTHGKDLRYHVVRDEVHNGEGACGVPVIATEGFAPEIDVTFPAESVPVPWRCMKPGCRGRWPEFDEASSLQNELRGRWESCPSL
jgi:hypothetical protein